MAEPWVRNALGHEPGWDMGDKEIPPLDAAIAMREMPPLTRETLLAAGPVVDARKRFAGFRNG